MKNFDFDAIGIMLILILSLLLLLILKVFGIVAWPWWVILSPLWLETLIVVVLAVIILKNCK
jgi:hypothetical protein